MSAFGQLTCPACTERVGPVDVCELDGHRHHAWCCPDEPQLAPRPDGWKGRWSWVNVKPCGTEAAYKRHLRHGEVACERCKAGANREQTDRRRKRKAARGAERCSS